MLTTIPRRVVLVVVTFCALIMLISGSAAVAPGARAHGELEAQRSDPGPGSLHGLAPKQVDLWFTEHLDPSRSTIEVYDAGRGRVDTGEAQIDPSDPQHMSIPLRSLPDGTYTVSWRSASQVDGHVLQGTFTFRVGQSRLPGGAATTEGEQPSPPAVGLRWVSLLGLAGVAGWFLIGLLGASISGGRRLALAGALLALAADLGLVLLHAYWPGGGLPRQSLASALAAMPTAWIVRIVLVAVLIGLIAARRGDGSRARLATGAMTAGAAVLTLTFTSHAAARESLSALAMGTNALHLESVAFWIGGVLHLAAVPAARQADNGLPLRRFSRLALLLAPLALLTGALNAGLILPSLTSLWSSDYGRVLLIKTAVVLGVLGCAWLNRRQIASGLRQAVRSLRSLRTEATLGASVLLVAALLALSAPPRPVTPQALHLRDAAGDGQFVHLRLDRADAGTRDLTFWLSGPDNLPLPDVSQATLDITMLERPIDLTDVRIERQPDGRWLAAEVPLTVKGWWQAEIAFQATGQVEPSRARFDLLLPDPTFPGPERDRESDPEGERLYQAAIDQLLQLRSRRSHEVLGDGAGNSLNTSYTFVAPDTLAYKTTAGRESIIVGGQQVYRDNGGPWQPQQRFGDYAFPANLPGYYSEADQFNLGREIELNGERCRILSFHAPGINGREEAWYAWWIGTESGNIHREAMAARSHYMTNTYSDFDAPIEIALPEAGV